MARREFRLPDPGEGLVEAEIVTWRVAVGDEVDVNDIVVEVETSKSLVELPIPFAGTVTALLVAEGDLVDVGAPIIAVEERSEAAEPAGAPDDLVPALPEPAAESAEAGEEAERGAGPGAAAEPGRVPMLVGYGPRTGEAKRRARKSGTAGGGTGELARAQLAHTFSTAAPVSRRADHRSPLPAHQDEPVGEPLPSPGAPGAGPGAGGPGPAPSGSVLAKPPVRKLAKDLGIDLATVPGSGPGGVITRDDVQAAARAEPLAAPTGTEAPAQPTAAAAASGDTRIPIRGVRKATAEAMVASAFTAPHVTEWLTCDVTAAMELLDRLRGRREFADVRLSPLVLVAKAVCLALARTPELNSAWDEAAQEIVLRRSVNLGFAADTPRGLLVPNVKDAQTYGLVDLAGRISELVATAREGRTAPTDTAQGTFTITNVGVFGVDAGTPILNPGEAGILCLGAIDRRPWVVGTGAEERLEPRWVTTLALSFDHRLVDGAEGSRFLADVAGLLRDPALALLY